MKSAKILSLIMTVTMLITISSGCAQKSPKGAATTPSTTSTSTKAELDPFGKYTKPVTIHLVRSLDPNVKFDAGQSIEKNGYIDEIKKQFNIDVKFDWVSAPGDFDQKLSLAIAANNIPDAAIVSTTAFKSMVKFGQVADMTSVLNNSGSDLLKNFYKSGGDTLKKLVEVDSKVMAIPNTKPKANGFNEMWIRKDWLTKLGIEAPKTLEDLQKVAKAFVDKDPDGNGKKDTIGIAGPSKTNSLTGTDGNQFGLDPIFSAKQSYPGYWLKDDSGKVIYGSTQPETKQALQEIADMYKNGLIDKEMFMRDDSLQPVLDNKTGIFFGPWWTGYTLSDAYSKTPAPDWQAYAAPLADDGNYYAHMAAPATDFLVVNKDYKYPEAAVKIVNLLLRDESKWIESGLSKNSGTGGSFPLFLACDNVDELESSYNILDKYMKGETKMEDVDFSTHKLLEGDMVAIKKLKKEPLDDYSVNNWDLKSELVKNNLPRLVSIMVGDKPLTTGKNIKEVYSLYYGQTQTMSSKWANLQKMEKETFSKIIMGVSPISTFDDFAKKWHDQGGDKILTEIADISK